MEFESTLTNGKGSEGEEEGREGEGEDGAGERMECDDTNSEEESDDEDGNNKSREKSTAEEEEENEDSNDKENSEGPSNVSIYSVDQCCLHLFCCLVIPSHVLSINTNKVFYSFTESKFKLSEDLLL